MQKAPYSYKTVQWHRYSFISSGRFRIVKVVEFSPLGIPNFYNLGFGDLLPDDSIDDQANSNNGDIVRVLSTVIHVVKDFINNFPDSRIFFEGSTPERTRMYTRMLKMYLPELHKEFIIKGLHKKGRAYEAVDFDPRLAFEYSAFIIQKIN